MVSRRPLVARAPTPCENAASAAAAAAAMGEDVKRRVTHAETRITPSAPNHPSILHPTTETPNNLTSATPNAIPTGPKNNPNDLTVGKAPRTLGTAAFPLAMERVVDCINTSSYQGKGLRESTISSNSKPRIAKAQRKDDEYRPRAEATCGFLERAVRKEVVINLKSAI